MLAGNSLVEIRLMHISDKYEKNRKRKRKVMNAIYNKCDKIRDKCVKIRDKVKNLVSI